MPSTLRIATPPVEAVVLHGAGEQPLQDFRNASTLDAVVRFRSLEASAGVSTPNRQLIDQLHAVTDWIIERPSAELRGLCEEPVFRVWLGDVERALAGELHVGAADVLLRQLPYLFLRKLEQIDDRPEWLGSIPATGRVAPLGGQHRLRPERGDLAVRIFTTEQGVQVQAANDARVTASFPSSRTAGGVRAVGIELVERRFSILDLELFSVRDFPELDRRLTVNGPTLGEAVEDCAIPLADAMDFLLQAWPECIPDVMAVFRGVVAIDAPDGHTYSASSGTAPLVIQLTLHPTGGAAVLAETIVHEAAHLKLHALTEMSALLIDDGIPRHHHPWRPDVRPLAGVLFGAHAFLNVAKMYEHAAANGVGGSFAQQQYELRSHEVCKALATLAREATFTQTGEALFQRMCQEARWQP